MGIASDLRQSVLQAAMQGKLTTQKTEDGDARDLLREIRAEKEKLVKEKKGKKEKPLAPLTDEEIPFGIPENWVWCRLGEIITLVSGQDFSPHQYSDTVQEGFPYITGASNFGNHSIIENRWTKTPRCIVSRGDLLLVCKGSGYGRVMICNLTSAHIARQIMGIRQNNNVDVQFILLFLESNFDILKRFGQGVIPGISRGDVLNMQFPLPPLPEQRRIVARVEALMKEIDELEQTEKELEAIKAAFPGDMKASLLQAAMAGKLTEQKAEDGDARGLLRAIREEKEKLVKEKKIKKEKPLTPITDEEIPFDIPENWVWCRLNNITVKEIRRGKSPKYSDVQSNTLSFAQKCNTKYDGIQMSLARYLDESTLKRYTEEDAIIDGDTIINSTGHGTLGRVGFFTDSNNPNHLTIYPDSHVTVVRPSRNCDSRFIHLYIKTQQSWFETKGEGSTNQTELKPAVIKSIVIPLPPLPEQRRIVEKLDQLLPLCDSLSEH